MQLSYLNYESQLEFDYLKRDLDDYSARVTYYTMQRGWPLYREKLKKTKRFHKEN